MMQREEGRRLGTHRDGAAPPEGGARRLSSAEMRSGPGFRVRTRIDRPDPGLVEGLRRFPSPDISDVMNRLYTMAPSIGNVTPPELTLAGPAVTVKVFPGDNLMVHKALDVVQEGDIVVVDTSGSMMTAVFGDMIATKARHLGVGGFVIDGLVRDLPGITALGDLPVFARGITPIGPLHRGPGELNYPISCGGIVVHPGDVVVGDPNGVAVVPIAVANTVLEVLEGKVDAENEYAAAVARGEFSNAWVDNVLAAGGLEAEQPGSPPAPDA
jgi:RraA family protein